MEDNYTDKVNEGRIKEMERIKRLSELDEPTENEDYRDPLAIDTQIIKKIVLSTGGPEDGFRLTFNEDKELLYGVYYRADWGTYKESSLTEDEAQAVYDHFLGGYIE